MFSARNQATRDRSKESTTNKNGTQALVLSDGPLSGGSTKKPGQIKDQNYIYEINNLKREINEEIKRERGERNVVSPPASLHSQNKLD